MHHLHGPLGSLSFLHPLNIFLAGHLDAIKLLNNIFLHPTGEVIKKIKCLFLILLQGIFLTVAAQPNPFFEMIHGKQMIFP